MRKLDNAKNWRGYGTLRALLDSWVDTGPATLENSWPYLMKLSICTLHDLAIPLLGYTQQKYMTGASRDIHEYLLDALLITYPAGNILHVYQR
jgi:hypothetical protein